MSSRRLQDVFKTFSRRFQDVFKTCLQDVLQLCLQNVFKTSLRRLGRQKNVTLKTLLSHELFELFLANTEMESVCVESTNYARLKGNHMFTMAVEKLKAFHTILLVGEYAGLIRRDIFWER